MTRSCSIIIMLHLTFWGRWCLRQAKKTITDHYFYDLLCSTALASSCVLWTVSVEGSLQSSMQVLQGQRWKPLSLGWWTERSGAGVYHNRWYGRNCQSYQDVIQMSSKVALSHVSPSFGSFPRLFLPPLSLLPLLYSSCLYYLCHSLCRDRVSIAKDGSPDLLQRFCLRHFKACCKSCNGSMSKPPRAGICFSMKWL